LARNGEEVVKARGTELISQIRTQSFVLAQDDSGDDSPSLPAHTRGQRAPNRGADPVRDAAQPSAPAYDRERARGKDDVDALAPEVAGLVEPVLLGTRLSDLDDRAQQGALRWSAPCREVEPRTLAGSLTAETEHTHGHANLERASPARTGHLEKRGA
jgi:hypothetical protein